MARINYELTSYWIIKSSTGELKVMSTSRLLNSTGLRKSDLKSGTWHSQIYPVPFATKKDAENTMINKPESLNWIPAALNLNDVSRKFIEGYRVFKWFIDRWIGTSDILILMAFQNNEKLSQKCNDIWYDLPDHIFNIKENPDGWMEFLRIVEQ